MPLTPEEIRLRSFPAVSALRRWAEGAYDRTEVDAFLAQVADDYSAAIQKIALGAEGNIDSTGETAAEAAEVLREASESALRINQKAREAADNVLIEAHQRARELREMATRTQTDARGKGEAEASWLVEEAEEKARELRESAERERRDALEQVQQRYESLTSLEGRLQERIGALEAFVGEMRAQIEPVEIDLTHEADDTPVDSESSDDAGPPAEDDAIPPPPPPAKKGSSAVPEPAGDSQAPASEGDKVLWELEERLRTASRREGE